MQNKKQQSQQPPSAPGSAQGQPVAPDTAPLTEDEPETGETEAIPIGMPGSAEELRRRKALAEQPQAPPEQAAGGTGKQSTPNADEDEPETGETEAIPIGMPGSAEELRRRKALAEQPQAPPEQAAGGTGKQSTPNADEDEPEA